MPNILLICTLLKPSNLTFGIRPHFVQVITSDESRGGLMRNVGGLVLSIPSGGVPCGVSGEKGEIRACSRRQKKTAEPNKMSDFD